jgi:hypothetical protein
MRGGRFCPQSCCFASPAYRPLSGDKNYRRYGRARRYASPRGLLSINRKDTNPARPSSLVNRLLGETLCRGQSPCPQAARLPLGEHATGVRLQGACTSTRAACPRGLPTRSVALTEPSLSPLLDPPLLRSRRGKKGKKRNPALARVSRDANRQPARLNRQNWIVEPSEYLTKLTA